MSLFQYDFGYGFLWNYGHLLAVVPFGVLAALSWRFGWPRWIGVVSLVLTAWGVAGLLIVQYAMRLNLPLELPTQQFVSHGPARVLDGGAGSGRASLMVLLERPQAEVLAIDLYEGYFGIEDNSPQRLLQNAAKAGVEDRVDAQVADLTDLPFEDGSFDAAVSAFVIDHLDQAGVERSLAEIERVLRPNGEFLLMVVNPDLWIRVAYPFFVHHGYFGGRTDRERWRDRLENAGLRVVEMGTTPGTLYLLAQKSPRPV
jgi:SAM-dependent methyltransferase